MWPFRKKTGEVDCPWCNKIKLFLPVAKYTIEATCKCGKIVAYQHLNPPVPVVKISCPACGVGMVAFTCCSKNRYLPSGPEIRRLLLPGGDQPRPATRAKLVIA